MKTIAAAALLALAAGTAHADEITLHKPLAGATLHEGGVDMSVYWTEVENGFEVVAYYLPRSGGTEPAKLAMVLEDGDHVSFGVPGEPQVSYTFARTGGAVLVDAKRPWNKLASN